LKAKICGTNMRFPENGAPGGVRWGCGVCWVKREARKKPLKTQRREIKKNTNCQTTETVKKPKKEGASKDGWKGGKKTCSKRGGLIQGVLLSRGGGGEKCMGWKTPDNRGGQTRGGGAAKNVQRWRVEHKPRGRGRALIG